MLDVGLYTTYILFIVAVAAAVVLPLLHALKTPASLGKSLAAVGVLVVLFLVSYAVASGDLTADQRAAGVSESTMKLIGAGLILFYIVLLSALIGIIYSEISKALK